jgi:competence protein ComEC
MHVLDVDQGDAILLISPSGKQILIDGGRDLAPLSHLGRILPLTDRTIELLVLTHPDLDHVAAFPELLKRYRIGAVLLTGVAAKAPAYEVFLQRLKDQNIPLLFADPALDLDLGDGLVLDIVWPPPGLLGKTVPNTNDTSIVMRALYRDHEILLTGDVEEKGEAGILASGADISADILKVGHHGSKTSSTTGFLLEVNPRLAIVSAGRDNDYGHPHAVVMKRFESMGIPVRVTAEEGTVSLIFR